MTFVHDIRVTWADCDPARIAYTGRLPAMALDAINAWWEHHLGGGWYQMELDLKVGTPFVSLQMDFRSPVTPRHPLLCEVAPNRLGRTSVGFRVIGRQDGITCFIGRFVCVFTAAPKLEKREPPEDIRDIVARHLIRDDDAMAAS